MDDITEKNAAGGNDGVNDDGNRDITRKITLDEQERLNNKWKMTVEGDADVLLSESGTAGEQLRLKTDDSPEFRAQLNNVNRRYRFTEFFAEGGFGRIFKAQDRMLDRTVIIKSLRREHLENRAAVDKFIAEAKLNAQLDHPAIVPLYSLDSDEGRGLHLAMKFIDGITMKEYLTRLKVKYNLNRVPLAAERQSLRVRLEYFIKVCQAIEYSHSRGIVHGDLKPDNIMLGAYGEVYIMDWGTAAICGVSRHGEVEGTPGYLAPEIINTGTMDFSGDVFSLGMILYELVTLRRGVEGDNEREINTRVRAGIFEPVRHHSPHLKIQPELRAIIYKAIEVDPDLRYPDPECLREDVRRYMFHEEVSALPDNPIQRLARKMYHNRVKTFSLAGVFLLLCAVMAAYGLFRQNRAERAAGRQVLQRIDFQFDTDRQGARIEKYFLHLQSLLRSFAGSMAMVLENHFVGEYDGEVFQSGRFEDNPPPGVIYSPAYRERISLDHPSYALSRGAMPEDVQGTVRRLYPITAGVINLLLQSDPDVRFSPGRRDELIHRLVDRGVPAQRLFALLKNGLMICYPGMADGGGGGEDFLAWDWYREAVRTGELFWGGPYVDRRGRYLLPCAIPLTGADGELMGAAGIDISFEYIIMVLMQSDSSRIGIDARKFLVDQHGRVVVSTLGGGERRTGASPKIFHLKPFEHISLLREMITDNSRQMEAVINGIPVIISYAPILPLNWYFVQIIDVGGLPEPRRPPRRNVAIP